MFRRFKNFRLSTKHIIVIALLVIHLSPIWIFKFIPTQDGSAHVYNASVLKDYHKHENYRLREVFKLNLALFPNWTSHAFMALLMYVFSPIVCEKILLSLCIALLPLSLFYFLNAVDRGKLLFGLLGFIYAYNYLLHMGFYNFALSISLFFFTLGYWWKHKDEMSLSNIGILYVLLLVTYFCHYQSYLQLVLSLSFFALFSYLYSAFVEIWGRKNSESDKVARFTNLKTFIRKLKPFLSFLGYMLPAYFIMLSYYLSSTRGYGRDYRSTEWLKEYFFDMKSLVYFRDDYIIIGRILLYLFAVAFLLTLWYRIREVYKFRKTLQSTAPKERLWTKIIDGKEQFLLMAGILTIIFFKSPWYLGSGGGWINDRVHIYIFLVLLPFFSVDFHKVIRYSIAGIIIVLSLWHLGYSAHDYYYLSKDISEMTSATGMLEEHTMLANRPDEWWGPSDYLGELKYVAPFLHVPSYLCLEKDIAYIPNYETEHDYFPINFKDDELEDEYSDKADYVMVWRTEYEDELEELKDDYVLVHSGRYNKLFRRKKAKIDEDLWNGKDVIKFDMQSHDGQTAQGHIPVFEDTVYVDGKYGWDAVSVREEFCNEADIPEPYRDGLWGKDDAVFKIALPNGTYKVTCHFNPTSDEDELVSYEVNIIANGKKVISNLKVPEGETVSKSYTITVTDERLTQVIYTGRGYNKRWVWNGCTIARKAWLSRSN